MYQGFRKNNNTTRGEASHDLILVASVVLVLGVLWVLSGGPSRDSGEDGNILGFQEFVSGPSSDIDSFFSPITRGGDTESDRAREIFGKVQDFGEISPHSGKVTIKRNTSPQQTSPSEESVVLSVSRSLTEPLVITGWKLQSMISNRVVEIPEATKVSTSGEVNIEQPIEVISGDELFILTGRSPVGHSFLVNKCSGYFEQFQDFSPPLQKRCPLPDDELVFAESNTLQFGNACLAFIEDMPRCEMQLNAIPEAFPDACHLFISREINYNSCVLNHRNDDDFFANEWRVYLRHDEELWGARDIIRLLDENGKTVDVFSYK